MTVSVLIQENAIIYRINPSRAIISLKLQSVKTPVNKGHKETNTQKCTDMDYTQRYNGKFYTIACLTVQGGFAIYKRIFLDSLGKVAPTPTMLAHSVKKWKYLLRWNTHILQMHSVLYYIFQCP
jgi:hypothetical protein